MISRFKGRNWTGAVVALLVLAGCAHRAPKPVPVAQTPVPAPMPLPSTPSGFQSINSGLAPMEAVWHLRSGLNVAALACGNRQIIANYNALLKRQKALLAAAHDAEVRVYQVSDGGAWRVAMDDHMTRLYNYFAQPGAKGGFCIAAGQLAANAQSVSAQDFPRFSSDAIVRLDQPFHDPQPEYASFPKVANAGDGLRSRASEAQIVPLTVVSVRRVDAGAWRVQLGAFSSAAAARSAWIDIRKRAPELASFNPLYEAGRSKNHIRLQIGPVADRAEAQRLCAAAVAASLNCMPVSLN